MNEVSSRSVLLSSAAGMVSGGIPAVQSKKPTGWSLKASTAPLYYFDLTPLYSADLSVPSEAAGMYDTVQLVAVLHGPVNRDEPDPLRQLVVDDGFYPVVQSATGSLRGQRLSA